MKQSEIVAGKAYTDGKGSIRLVMAVGDFPLYSGQMNRDCVQYRLEAKKRGPYLVGTVTNATRVAFASWAKAVVEQELKPPTKAGEVDPMRERR